ncbi:sigma factor [Nitrosomonas marina]|uniref:RNA polymerase sigma-70 factor, ECF subfamily n=1 Tax=Nitrosomonas marina TaxID=917 RepID=A0A1H8FKT7_9PROT|nr:sigma factor [Nitrosomonas marina]SEN32210.1 RNA polymerase sigma-70 factor, ECF subfamily [Nitrosomonas marina]
MSQPVFSRHKETVWLSDSATESDNISAVTDIENLYRNHHRWLLTWLRQKLNCGHKAADVADDTIARILTLSHLPCLRRPRAYLATTAKRLLIDQSRRQKRVVSAMQILDKICSALAGPAEKPRMVFLLHYIEGQTHYVIADTLGVSDRMVRKYLVQTLVHCYHFYESK